MPVELVEVPDKERAFVNDTDFTVDVDMLDAIPLTDVVIPPPPIQDSRVNEATASERPPIPREYLKIEHDAKKEGADIELRKQMRKIMPPAERDYWWGTCEPKPKNIVREVRKALNVPRSETNKNHNNEDRRKRPRLENIAAAPSPLAKGQNRKSETNKRKNTFFEDLATADLVIFKAHRQKYVCDGTELPQFDAKAMCDGIRKVRSPATDTKPGRHWSAEYTANKLGYPVVAKEDLRTLEDEPFVVYDRNMIPLVFNLPGYFGEHVREKYTGELLVLFDQVKLSTKLADAKTRGAEYVFEEGRPVGCVNMAHTWLGLMRRKTDLMPSAHLVHGGKTTSLVKSATAYSNIQTHQKKTRNIGTMLNYALKRCHPESFWAYLTMSTALQELIPAAKSIATHDPALSTGKSIIVSRMTPLHHDNKEAPESWSPLVIMGDCKTGMLSIPRLGIKFSYLPGTLVMLRGRLLEHEVVEWDGKGLRICVAHFTHQAEWDAANVIPPL